MPPAVRDHVTAVTGVLSAVSIGVIVAAVRGAIPAAAIPVEPTLVAAVPHLNASISVLAIAAITGGWRSIRRGVVPRHRAYMSVATLLFASFLALYLYRITIIGTTAFTGPSALYATVYLPVLVIHMALAVTCIPLVYYAILIGFTHPVDEIPGTLHPRIGRVAAPLWITSFALGIAVYAMLYVLW